MGKPTSLEIDSDPTFPVFESPGGSDACEDANGEEENICKGLEDGGEDAISSSTGCNGEEGTSVLSDMISCGP